MIGVEKPPWMEMDQWWRLWHRTRRRWTQTCNMNVDSAIRERALSWAGHVARMDHKEICAKALRCRGLQWWRWRQLHWKEVEKDKWSGPHPQQFKIYRWEDMVATEFSKFTGNVDGFFGISPAIHGLAASCSKPWKLETVREVWNEPPGASGTQVRPAWCGLVLMGGCGIEWPCLAPKAGQGVENGRLRERLRTRGLASICYPSLCIKPGFDLIWMSSWCSAGYGWPSTVGSGNGRRSGSWDNRSEDEWYCLKCRMELWRSGAFLIVNVKVLSWNVVRDLILLQISMLAHSSGLVIWCEWRTRAIQAWKTVLPGQAQNTGKDGWTKAVWTVVGAGWLRWIRWLRWLRCFDR